MSTFVLIIAVASFIGFLCSPKEQRRVRHRREVNGGGLSWLGRSKRRRKIRKYYKKYNW